MNNEYLYAYLGLMVEVKYLVAAVDNPKHRRWLNVPYLQRLDRDCATNGAYCYVPELKREIEANIVTAPDAEAVFGYYREKFEGSLLTIEDVELMTCKIGDVFTADPEAGRLLAGEIIEGVNGAGEAIVSYVAELRAKYRKPDLGGLPATERAIRYFNKAEAMRLLEPRLGGYKWNMSKTLLAFFLGEIYCKGGGVYPEAAAARLFGVERLGEYYSKLSCAKKKPQDYNRELGNLFTD